MSSGPLQSIPAISLTYLFSLQCTCNPGVDLGTGPYGRRILFDIKEGTFEGPFFRGTVREGGADWCLQSANGSSYIDTRYNLETDDGAIIFIQTTGVANNVADLAAARPGLLDLENPPSQSDRFARLSVKLETGDSRYEWLSHLVIVASLQKVGDLVSYNAYAVL